MINTIHFQIWWVQDIYCLDQKSMGFNNNMQRASYQQYPTASEKTTAVDLPIKIYSKFYMQLPSKIY